MLSRWLWLWRRLSRQLWFTVAVYCALGIITALSALLLEPLIPGDISSRIGADAVDRILGVLASSMLAVTTFSIATMVQAFASASTSATPRATQLLVEDRSAQRALATFIGSFVFSLVSIIALSTGVYGPSGRLVLFLVTLGVIVLIVVMLLRWIDRLSKLGRVGETVDQVERAALRAIKARRKTPCLGGHPAVAVPETAIGVVVQQVGYVERIDMARLAAVARDAASAIHVRVLPGSFLTPERAVAYISADLEDKYQDDVRAAFVVGGARSFDQDPRFGMIVLAEVASRALSPAVNDPGTAIDVIGTAVRLFSEWSKPDEKDGLDKVAYPDVYVPPITAQELVEDAFTPIARDGAALIEVGVRLIKGLYAVSVMSDPDMRLAAIMQARNAQARCEKALSNPHDLARLREACGWLSGQRTDGVVPCCTSN
ncbi:MAG: DUF2254 domain-containing protein [Xanthobacteraceae bacterium]|nr:DUF2254 domain-containing protein [Xanthobacteraceae bacterium]